MKNRETLVQANRELLANEAEIARLGREGWSYLVLDDAIEAIVRGLVAPFTGARVALLAAETTRLPIATETLLDRYAQGVERRRRFPGRSSLVDTTSARELLDWTPRHSLDVDPELVSEVAQ